MDKKSTARLIIFYRNPQEANVKTRLAATLGQDKARQIYVRLAQHTRDVAEKTDVDKIVFYSDFVDTPDMWPDATYQKAVQHGHDLGARMKNAFKESFARGYTSVCIIGTDCFELSQEVIDEAFESLHHSDAVVGPAKDGGYYLLGMNQMLPALFDNKRWSTNTVLNETIRDLGLLGLHYTLLRTLADVDTEEDLPDELR
ncbi:MAG TPA: TIGR04282 family arsenosugar biosynthesis glycosyltransferase [Chryseosolibacter sp.]